MKVNVMFGAQKVVHRGQSIGFRDRWGRKQDRKARPELAQGSRYKQLIFTECLFCFRHWAKYYTHIIHISLMSYESVLLLSPFLHEKFR